jgi:lipopolysaccharide/colanic/teichoic acid biosynthesis glycosyltransferase
MPGWIQRIGAIAVLVLLSPLLAVIALSVRLTSKGPAIHRAVRLGRGRPFTLYKFRTMVEERATGSGVTVSGDPRITELGRVLRGTKLDELPQLWNVARGEMLLVGPRPEDPRYVDWDDPVHREVFNALPGITGPAAIAYRDEERVLAAEAASLAVEAGRQDVAPTDVDRAYRERILPAKLALDREYLRTRSVRRDLSILGQTLRAVVVRRRQ